MTDLVETALSFVDCSNSYQSAKELLAHFNQVIASFGFKHYIMTGLPAYGEDVEQLIVANAWPVQWTDRYREGRYFFDDPVTKWSFSSARAFKWQDARDKSPATRRAAQIESEAKEFGLVDGLGFPMFDPDNWQAVVSLAADRRVELSTREVAVMQIAAAICQGQAAELIRPSRPEIPRLTGREIDVLTWMAHGKTRWETAEILGTSDRTIKRHLENILAKLNVANTTQAVARAVHSRQIRL